MQVGYRFGMNTLCNILHFVLLPLSVALFIIWYGGSFVYDLIAGIIDHNWITQGAGEQQYIYYIAGALICVLTVVFIDVTDDGIINVSMFIAFENESVSSVVTFFGMT